LSNPKKAVEKGVSNVKMHRHQYDERRKINFGGVAFQCYWFANRVSTILVLHVNVKNKTNTTKE